MDSFASDLLHEVKVNSKRWFIAFCVMVAVEIATIFGFMWYISLPVEESETVYTQESDNNGYNQIVGGDYNGGETISKDNLQAQGNAQ